MKLKWTEHNCNSTVFLKIIGARHRDKRAKRKRDFHVDKNKRWFRITVWCQREREKGKKCDIDCAISIIHEAFAGFFFIAFEIKKKARSGFKFIKDILPMKGIDMKRGKGIIAVRHIKTVKRKMLLFADAKCNWNDKLRQKRESLFHILCTLFELLICEKLSRFYFSDI